MSEELEKLDAQCAALDNEVAPQPVAVPEVAQAAPVVSANEVQELASVLQMIAGLFVPVFPSLQTIYTPETCHALASAAVPVMLKRGWSLASVTAGWGEEIALGAVAIPLGFATWQAVKADIAQAEKLAKLADKTPAAAGDRLETGAGAQTQLGQAADEPIMTPRG